MPGKMKEGAYRLVVAAGESVDCGSCGRIRGMADAFQDRANHLGLSDRSDLLHPGFTPGAFEHVNGEHTRKK